MQPCDPAGEAMKNPFIKYQIKMNEKKTYCVVIPVYGSRISPRLDCANHIQIIWVEGGKIQKSESVQYVSNNSLDKFNMLLRLKPSVLICDGITNIYKNILEEKDIKVIPWVTGEKDEVLSKYLSGQLKEKQKISMAHKDV